MAQNTLEIVAKVRADTAEAQKSIQQLIQQFQKFQLGGNLGKNITTEFAKVEKAYNKLQQITSGISGNKATVEQLEQIKKAGKDIDEAMSSLYRNVGQVKDKDILPGLSSAELEATKKQILDLQANFAKIFNDPSKKIDIFGSLDKNGWKKFVDSGFAGNFEQIYSNIKQAAQNLDGKEVLASLQNLKDGIAKRRTEIGNEIKQLADSLLINRKDQTGKQESFDLSKFTSELTQSQKDIETKTQKIKASAGQLNASLFGVFSDKSYKGLAGSQAKTYLLDITKGLSNFDFSKIDQIKQAAEGLKKLSTTGFGTVTDAQKNSLLGAVNDQQFSKFIKQAENAQKAVQKIKDDLVNTYSGTMNKLGLDTSFNKIIKSLDLKNLDTDAIDKITKSVTELQNKFAEGSKEFMALDSFKNSLNRAFSPSVRKEIDDTAVALKDLNDKQQEQQKTANESGLSGWQNFVNGLQQAVSGQRDLTSSTEQTTNAIIRQKEEFGQVISRFAQFGTMTGIVRTFGKVVRSAFRSVKELDEAMNNIAVVTDYTTKDLWNQIDAYTAMAQATGSTIKGSYEVAQLYYQQGLTDAEVMAAANETLKMARISNIDYAKATDYATAAIKGFGLAYQDLAHINDVYSNLAAKTAADTEEISIAMSKVASIAHSTGMELETTAAFLTQIIATTREAPETAGTALKTVIARFAEVKELISKGETTGTDEEGTEISVNNIEAALKTAGVALRDTTGQMRDLDDVFIELASRWDSLDTMQQRYIATQAAGSRQQSRFLAMMNDYEGLQETLGYAMDSAGASQEQFNKTLDSLQSKLNNLSNAWTEFTTGIMNSDFIKGGVDILTKILDVINDITGALGSGGSTISKMLLTFGALRYGTGAAGNLLTLLGVPNKLPTIKDQWNTGLGNIISSFGKASFATKGIVGEAIQLSSGKFINATTGEDVTRVIQIGQAFYDAGNQALTAGQKVKVFWGALTAAGKASVVIAGITAVIVIIQLLAKVIKTTKEQAQEFQETLSELQNVSKEIKDLEKTLSNLRAYQEGVKDKTGKTIEGMDDFATLQKGVGSYGQNISLTSEQYSRYLEICDAIVALNPDIAKGYDNNAEAIAKNASALEDLIAKQEEQIRNKAIQTAITMDDKFYKDTKAQAKETQEEINAAKIKRSNLNQQYFSTEDLTQTGILTDKEFEALRKGGLTPYNQSLKELTENEEKYRQQIRETIKDIDAQELALSGLTKISTYYGSSLDDLNSQIELSSKALETQKDDIKEQWTAMLPGIDGWYELSDAQQAFIRKSIRGMDIDLFDDSSMKQQEQEIKNWVRDVQTLLSNTEPIQVTLDGKTAPYLMKDIVDALGSGEFDRLGLTAGLDWLNGFYQGLLSFGESHPELQNGIMKMLGFEGTCEDFGKQTSSQFAEQVYGTSYTDRVANMRKFATERAEGSWGKEFPEQAYSDWYDWLAELDDDTASTIMEHWDELGNYLTTEEGPLSKANAESAAQRYLETQKTADEIIKKGVDRGLDEERLKNYVDFLQEVGSIELQINRALAAQTALRAMLYDQAVENVNTNLDSWKQAAEQSDKNPEEWANARTEAKQALADLLTVDLEQLPDDLEITAETLEDIGKLAKNDTKTLAKMVKTITKSKIDKIKPNFFENLDEQGQKAYSQVEEIIDKVIENTKDIPIGVSIDEATKKDVTSFTSQLMNIGLSAEQAGKIAGDALSMAGVSTPDISVKELDVGQEYEIPSMNTYFVDAITGEVTKGGLKGDKGIATGKVRMVSLGDSVVKEQHIGNAKPSGGGGGGSSKPTKPKQDPFYNYIKTVDDYKKRLESLQDVQELLNKPVDIFNNTKAQEDYYKTLLGSNQSYLNHVNSELERLQKEAQSKYSKYIEVSIDGSLRLTEEYWASTGDITEELDEWIDAYDDVLGRQKDLTDEINDYKKELKKLWEGWRDSFIDLTNDIADVFQELDEKQLEDRQEFYEKLEEQDQRYLESVRNNIEEERKARERANSFEDLQKKQSRLALLQRDSSGRYVNDIAELQEEINSDQQDLADQNVDNILDTLEKQMDKDAERHQDILDAMQKQIDSNVENRIYIERAEQTIAQGEQAILDAIHMGEDWRNASNAEREKMDEEQATNIAGSKSYLEKLNEGITSSSEYISKMVTDALTKQTESLIWTIGDIPQNDEAHVAHAMETTLPSILEQFFARTTTAQDMANDNKVSGARYASGGLVDYTGPAWVDGTPGKPEAFLNANQTAMIAAFTSNLAKMISGKFPSSNVEAGSNCEINIDIGSIGADYDIDQAINKVKQEIVNSAQFRNVTLLNRRR